MVISSVPQCVYWLSAGNRYCLMQLRPSEMKSLLRRNDPDYQGIPQYWSIIDDDVVWWPSWSHGTFEVIAGAEFLD
jgi:hypothetical protein